MEMFPLFALTKIFEVIFEAEDQNNEFDMIDLKTRSIQFNKIVKALCMCPNMELSQSFD